MGGLEWDSGGDADVDPAELSHTACPCCDTAIDSAAGYVRYPPFVLVQCRHCAFRFVGNPASDSQLYGYYAESYGKTDSVAYHEMQRGNAATNMALLRRHFSAYGKRELGGVSVLDVGAGYGYLVAEMCAQGMAACGVELSKAATDYAACRLGLQVYNTGLDSLNAKRDRFDLITACDVIEHIPHPRAFVWDCVQLLKPSGVLMLKTDNFESTVARVMGLHFYRLTPVEHVSLFTPATLSRLASSCGLVEEAVYTWTPGYSVRWAVKHLLRRTITGPGPPPDPACKHIPGPPMSLLGRMSNPLFALLSSITDLDNRGVEFGAFYSRGRRRWRSNPAVSGRRSSRRSDTAKALLVGRTATPSRQRGILRSRP
jgi:SAM-dependent methyltransferase